MVKKAVNTYKHTEWLVILFSTIYNAFKNSLTVCLFRQLPNRCHQRNISFIPYRSNSKVISNHDKITWHVSITSIIPSIFISRSLGQMLIMLSPMPGGCHSFYINILFTYKKTHIEYGWFLIWSTFQRCESGCCYYTVL